MMAYEQDQKNEEQRLLHDSQDQEGIVALLR